MPQKPGNKPRQNTGNGCKYGNRKGNAEDKKGSSLVGRPGRKDVDYFPFYVKNGKTLFILESKYECKGTGFFTNVMKLLSQTQDHHFQIKNEADRLYFFATVKCDEASGTDMLAIMVETGKLDRDLWEQKKVIASKDYIDSIQDAYRKRSNNCISIDDIKSLYSMDAHTTPTTPGETAPQNDTNATTIETNPPPPLPKDDSYFTKRKRKLKGKRLNTFDMFWEAFDYKSGRAEAADAWLDIQSLTDGIVEKIVSAAKIEARNRPQMTKTPKMAQGWLTGRRWEDEDLAPEKQTTKKKPYIPPETRKEPTKEEKEKCKDMIQDFKKNHGMGHCRKEKE